METALLLVLIGLVAASMSFMMIVTAFYVLFKLDEAKKPAPTLPKEEVVLKAFVGNDGLFTNRVVTSKGDEDEDDHIRR